MPRAVFKQALAFVQRSNITQIRILGGEPTLHPRFVEFIELALAMELPIRLFSNGAMPETALDCLSRLHKEKITIIVNVTRLSDPENIDLPVLADVFTRLGDKIIPGFNISNLFQDLSFIFDLVVKYDFQNTIRLGIAHPCMGNKNEHLATGSLVRTGRKIAEFAKQAVQKGIKINLDCGFTPCMFAGYDLKELGLNEDMGTHCQPILDILPDGRVVACFALCNWGKRSFKESNAETLRHEFSESLSAFQTIGVFKTCSICEYKKRDLCTGGGVCRKISRLSLHQR